MNAGPNDPRAALRDRFERRWQAAEELWARGYPAESWLLLRDSLHDVARELHGYPAAHAALTGEIEGLVQEASALGDALHAAGYTRAHAAWLERARQLSSQLRGRLESGRRRPRRRIVEAAGGALAVAAALWGGFHLASRPNASSSAQYSADFPAAHAVDGLPATEWLLPDHKLGYLEIRLPWKRSVRSVTITNSHNKHYLDRAARRARIIVFDEAKEVDRAEVSFPALVANPAPVTVALKGKPATRLRIQIVEAFGTGGGIAEIEIE